MNDTARFHLLRIIKNLKDTKISGCLASSQSLETRKYKEMQEILGVIQMSVMSMMVMVCGCMHTSKLSRRMLKCVLFVIC